MKLRNKLIKFMYGRYGIDELYKFLFKFYLFTFIINLFIKSIIIEYIGVLLVIIIFYRVFSKNVTKRRKENNAYIKLRNKIIQPLKKQKNKLLDKDHIYKTCSNCKTTLKLPLPYKRGIKHTKCPKCKKRLTLFVIKKQKIEIIKKSKTKQYNKK